MWYRIYNNQYPQNNKQYTRKKAKFEISFLQDRGQRLTKLISDTVNAETLWEIPKGRRQELSGEQPLNAAIREFTEETTIKRDQYELLLHIKPYIETYSDFGTTYQNIYYYARAKEQFEPSIKFSNGSQIFEVSAINWCSLSDIKNLKIDPVASERLIKMFQKTSKKYKNYIKRGAKQA
jgi:8-oxo-dGTP pyrophosphatase MutT (NUDIX family)